MMEQPLSYRDAEHIAGILNAANTIVGTAQVGYVSGAMSEGMVVALETVQTDLALLLAFFEDGAGYGWAKPDAIETMRTLEQIATDLLVALAQD